jgi:hypothetical protein
MKIPGRNPPGMINYFNHEKIKMSDSQDEILRTAPNFSQMLVSIFGRTVTNSQDNCRMKTLLL